MTFKHSGDLGDIIYCLPTIKALGGGDLLLEAEVVKMPGRFGPNLCLTMEAAAPLLPLLRAQPYISSVQPWEGGKVDVDFTGFRTAVINQAFAPSTRKNLPVENLAIHQAKIASAALSKRDIPFTYPWLFNVGRNYEADVVFARSARYHNDRFPWRRAVEKYRKDAVFLGLPEEHEAFVKEFSCSDIPHYPTADLLEAAAVIHECALFVGGQSCLYPIAEGLGKRAVLEVWPRLPSNLFFREGVVHGWDENVVLPELHPT